VARPRQKDELLAEVRRILVGGEAGAERRDLEEDTVRLAEVDGAEPEAVDDRRRPAAGLLHPLPPRLLVLHRRRPRDVMHRAGAGNAGARSLFVADPTAPGVAARLAVDEAERIEERRVPTRIARVRVDAFESLQRHLARDLWMVGNERLVGNVGDDEIVLQPLGIGEGNAAGALPPELDRVLRADAPDDGMDHPDARAPGRGAGVLEERDVGARRPVLGGVEEAIDGGTVL